MEIEKDYHILKACRFCPMCRHLCPSGKLTKHESDYPRGRALILFSVFRGEKYNTDYVNSIYNCLMCSSCFAGCQGNFNLPDLLRLSRIDIVKLGLEPEIIKTLKDNILKFNNTFGINSENSFTFKNHKKNDKNASKIFHIFGENINFKIGEIAKSTIELYEKLGLEINYFANELDCGKTLSILGYEDIAKEVAKKFFNVLAEMKVEKLIVSEPLIYDCLKNDFKRWDLDLKKINIELLHFASFIENIIIQKNIKLKKYLYKTSVVDSEYLCKINNECDAYRNIVKSSAKDNFTELHLIKNQAFPTGEAAYYYNGNLFNLGEELNKKIYEDAKKLKIKTLVVLSSVAKKSLSEVALSDVTTSDAIKIYHLAEFISEVI